MTGVALRRVASIGAALLLGGTAVLRAEDAALELADLAAYRAALSADKGTREPPAVVEFRELWNHPAKYQGRRVAVRGRLVRRFRQGPIGTFPPLEEAWVFSPAGDPFCLVFPAASDPAPPKPSAAVAGTRAGPGAVQFAGTFLKLVEYQGGDGARLAPLIVGPAAPVATAAALPGHSPEPRVAEQPVKGLDWSVALGAAAVVALVLAYQHMRRPVARPLRLSRDEPITPEPFFDDAPASRRPEPQ